jgi:hypothetical protein
VHGDRRGEELGPFNEVDQRLKTVSVVQKCRSSRSSTVNFADRKGADKGVEAEVDVGLGDASIGATVGS